MRLLDFSYLTRFNCRIRGSRSSPKDGWGWGSINLKPRVREMLEKPKNPNLSAAPSCHLAPPWRCSRHQRHLRRTAFVAVQVSDPADGRWRSPRKVPALAQYALLGVFHYYEPYAFCGFLNIFEVLNCDFLIWIKWFSITLRNPF